MKNLYRINDKYSVFFRNPFSKRDINGVFLIVTYKERASDEPPYGDIIVNHWKKDMVLYGIGKTVATGRLLGKDVVKSRYYEFTNKEQTWCCSMPCTKTREDAIKTYEATKE